MRRCWIIGSPALVATPAVALVAALVAGACGGSPDSNSGAGSGSRSGSDGPIELQFGHVGAPGSLFAESAQEFARRVDAEMDGRVRVVVFGSSQLGGPPS